MPDKTIKADLHSHGTISLSPKVLRRQGYGDKNPLQLMINALIQRGITISAITSEDLEILPYSEADRLRHLVANCGASLGRGYKVEFLGQREDVLVAERNLNGRTDLVYLVNGQTVVVKNNGERYDHLVVGTTQVPNLKSFPDTIRFCYDHGYPNFLEHPGLKAHFGAGIDLAERLLGLYQEEITGVEAHNAQLIVPEFLSALPLIGEYNRGLNRKAAELAEDFGKPQIATSDSHRIQNMGTAYIEFIEDDLDTRTEARFISSLMGIITGKRFISKRTYQNPLTWAKWTFDFKMALKRGEIDSREI